MIKINKFILIHVLKNGLYYNLLKIKCNILSINYLLSIDANLFLKIILLIWSNLLSKNFRILEILSLNLLKSNNL
jgi:hypothetical protein